MQYTAGSSSAISSTTSGSMRTIAGESEINRRTMEPAAQDRGDGQTRPRGTRPVHDRRAVKHQRFLGTRRERLKLTVARHTDLQTVHAVVERQIDGVRAELAVEARHDRLLHRLGRGCEHLDPTLVPLGKLTVEIQSAHAGGRHVRHGQRSGQQLVVRLNGRALVRNRTAMPAE